MIVDNQKYTLEEAEIILRKRKCQNRGHDFDVASNRITGTPIGIRCLRCGDYWRVFNPVDSPTIAINTIDAPTQFVPRQYR